MKFQIRNADGTKSIDAKVRRLLKYVNGSLSKMDKTWTESEQAHWACKVIEQGVKNIANQVFAQKVA